MALPKNCTECNRKLTASNRASAHGSYGIDDTCVDCYEYFGWENTHADEGHDLPDVFSDEQAIADCPVCQSNKPTAPEPKSGHKNTKPNSWSSHANCKHGKTPRERAACRKARAAAE